MPNAHTAKAEVPEYIKARFNYQLDFLRAEYEAINQAIARMDDTTAKVKNWALITWAGSVALVLKEQRLTQFLWLTALLPLLFFFIDAWWRRIQRSFIFRVQQISHFLNSEMLTASFREHRIQDFTLLDPRASESRNTAEFKSFTSVFKTMRFKEVAAFYLGLSILSLAMWLAVNWSEFAKH